MDQKRYPPETELRVSERDFWSRFASLDGQINAYEDDILQVLAHSLVPVDKLEKEAMKQCGTATMNNKTRDALLRELLRWFKYEFFTWTDKPKCEKCQGTTAYHSHLDPTSEEQRYGASRVEGYRCETETCSAITRFPRYNDPGKLLETRAGRCGEWANCFTLCCRAMYFEARYVLDWTDHVWTEVYSPHQRRWLHCDPCENACDTPYMYEEGWGKKLTYVIAFSKEEIVDVTWRYSRKHRDVWRRRLACRESVLIRVIDELNAKRLQSLPEARRRILNDRRLVECVELLWPRLDVKDSETEGRTSGDVQWRLERGELGTAVRSDQEKDPFVFQLADGEIEKLSFVLEYYSAPNEYLRPMAGGDRAQNWDSRVHEAKDVFRKVEHDWKVAYLARKEGAAVGTVSWKFDLSSDQVEIDELTVKVDRKTFESGVVRVLLCQENMCCPINDSGELKMGNLESSCFEIKAALTGGQGDCAWQHAQLFRASTDEGAVTPSLVIKAKLRRKGGKCQ